ncbi:MAG: DUF167 domain-containing protein [Armatimonadetes bacterium]|nr:DUF167 domain-containing protein [Armatimonadota bacterium]
MSRLRVRLTPRGGRNAIEALRDGVLHVRVSTPPVDGAANRALVELVAERLDVPKSSVSIATGATSRHKVLEVSGLDDAALASRFCREGD